LSVIENGKVSAETGVRLWKQTPALEIMLNRSSGDYLSAYGSVGYQVLDELLASERYLRARQRNQPLLCWRFIRVKPDRWLQLLFSWNRNWQVQDLPLTTWEIKTLDGMLSTDERARFSRHLSWSDQTDMDNNMLWFTADILRLLSLKAKALGEPLPINVIERHLSFLGYELDQSAPLV
jgi:hypothetical protein